jgi:hypothetical protein
MDYEEYLFLHEKGRVIDRFGDVVKVQITTLEGIYTVNARDPARKLNVGDQVKILGKEAVNYYFVDKID